VELARSIVSRFRQFIGDRRHARRVQVRLPFTVSLAGSPKSQNGSTRIKSLKGHTLDLSPTGLALIVPAIIVSEHHLVNENRNLNVRLELPDGVVEIQVSPIRYESLDEHRTETGYLIGTRIVSIAEADQGRYKTYVSELLS
jgi:c-di-GMP-binding flagellar brake protein YcgR